MGNNNFVKKYSMSICVLQRLTKTLVVETELYPCGSNRQYQVYVIVGLNPLSSHSTVKSDESNNI